MSVLVSLPPLLFLHIHQKRIFLKQHLLMSLFGVKLFNPAFPPNLRAWYPRTPGIWPSGLFITTWILLQYLYLFERYFFCACLCVCESPSLLHQEYPAPSSPPLFHPYASSSKFLLIPQESAHKVPHIRQLLHPLAGSGLCGGAFVVSKQCFHLLQYSQ